VWRAQERELVQQLRQHRRIANSIVGDLDGPDLKCVGINAQMYLAPLPAVFGAVFLGLPLALPSIFMPVLSIRRCSWQNWIAASLMVADRPRAGRAIACHDPARPRASLWP